MTKQEFLDAIDEAWFMLEDKEAPGICPALAYELDVILWRDVVCLFKELFSDKEVNQYCFWFNYAGKYANPDRHFALHLFKEIVLDSKEYENW